ncbi:MAG: hypothetical protein HC800_19820 [Phormidesmis sp. RL_2_1]|nr:hypothetical protein [Phormidesmis sp. RL_2_1]
MEIDGASWESTFPQHRPLEIEMQVQSVSEVSEQWTWQLMSHNRETLLKWHCEGISPDLPILLFDFHTGERLVLPHGLKGKTEIICFYEASAQVIYSEDIELMNGFVPCSLTGWRGQQLYLNSPQAELTIQSAKFTTVIVWDGFLSDDCPQLRGLKLRSRALAYTEMPEVWYPPIQVAKTLSIQIEDLNNRETITDVNEQVTLQASAQWQSISLSRWIRRSGQYSVQIWNRDRRWSEKFEWRSSFEAAPHPIFTHCVHELSNPVEVPIQASSVSNFWLRDLTMQALWPLEEIRFVLTNRIEEHAFTRQADSQGSLALNLAPLHDILPEADQYALYCYNTNERKCCLLEILVEQPVGYSLDAQTIKLSGLQTAPYKLSIWNLLRPEEAVSIISFEAIAGVKTFEFPLRESISDDFGLFHIQLESALQAPLNIGWWSGVQAVKSLALPDNIDGDCCFNILDNETVEEFKSLFQNLDLSIDCNRIENAIASLSHTTHYLPDCLDRLLLRKKLETFLSKVIAVPFQAAKEITPLPKQTSYLIEVQNSSRHKAFQKLLQSTLKQKKIDQQVICVKDRLLYDLIRVELTTPDILPELNRTISQLGDKLGTDVTLKEWKR